ncbi:hypothetical protein PBCVNEJV1_893L [Paramecium bursaria Chlorella virus NE-JV-1]|nr:hypothetical protein PBCVNEJV1_893L [Paramecium bursaria Chlorella virus NE-JV-1]
MVLGIKVVLTFDALPNKYAAEILPEAAIDPDTIMFPMIAEVATVTLAASTLPRDVTFPVMFKFADGGGDALIPIIFEPMPFKYGAVRFPAADRLSVIIKFP